MTALMDTFTPSAPPRWRKHWRPSEDARRLGLIEAGLSYAQQAAALGRTPEGVRLQAARTRTGLTQGVGGRTAGATAALLGLPDGTVREWIARGWLRATAMHMRRDGRPYWIVARRDLVEFLADPAHQHRWRPEWIRDSGLRAWTQEMQANGGRYLTPAQAGRVVGRSDNAVRRAIVAGKVAAVRTSNGYLVRERDVVEWRRGEG